MPTFPANEALRAFTPFIGTWKTTGTHGMIPNTDLHGHTTFTWHETNGFILMQTSIQEDVGIPAGFAVIGSDDVHGTCVMVYYDVRGVSRHYQVRLDGYVLTWWRDAPEFFQRSTLTISEDGQTIVGKGEISHDSTTWEQDLNLTYHRE